MDLVKQLTELNELRKNGALNDVEFAKAKAALLPAQQPAWERLG